jgi:hypothetical protein
MPITSIPSYVTTADTFLEHWTLVESTTGTEFNLQTGQGKADFTDLREDTAAAITALEAPLNARAIASNDLLVKRAELNTLIADFNRAVRYLFRTTNYPKALPKVPTPRAGFGVFTKACDDVSNLWTTINANVPPVVGFTPPLLVSTVTLAQFNTKVAAVKTAFTTLTNKDQDLRLKREQRNLTLKPLRATMVLYRQAVLATFSPTNALVLSCPKVTPAPGSTPTAVHFGAAWNASLGKAECVWTLSSDPNLQEYEVRACDPPKYKGDEEEVVASVLPPDNTLETDFGLLVAGAAKIFAVYVKTTTGNEKRSNVVKVTRP